MEEIILIANHKDTLTMFGMLDSIFPIEEGMDFIQNDEDFECISHQIYAEIVFERKKGGKNVKR